MSKVLKVGVSMGLQGCRIEAEIEVESNANPEEIDAEVREWALGHIDWWFEEKEL